MELEELGIREECGVFGCIASGVWPTELDVPHVITLGLVGLQHSFQSCQGGIAEVLLIFKDFCNRDLEFLLTKQSLRYGSRTTNLTVSVMITIARDFIS